MFLPTTQGRRRRGVRAKKKSINHSEKPSHPHCRGGIGRHQATRYGRDHSRILSFQKHSHWGTGDIRNRQTAAAHALDHRDHLVASRAPSCPTDEGPPGGLAMSSGSARQTGPWSSFSSTRSFRRLSNSAFRGGSLGKVRGQRDTLGQGVAHQGLPNSCRRRERTAAEGVPCGTRAFCPTHAAECTPL